MSRSKVGLVALSLALVCAWGCRKKEEAVEPPPTFTSYNDDSDPAREAFEKARATAHNQDLNLKARLGALRDFQLEYPQHPLAEEAKLLSDQVRDGYKIERAASLAQSRVSYGLELGRGRVLGGVLEGEPWGRTLEAMLGDLMSQGYATGDAEGAPLVVHGPGLAPRTLRGAQLITSSAARYALSRSMLRLFPASFPASCADRFPSPACVNQSLNTLTQRRLGAPLYRAEGQLNPDAIQALIKAGFPQPDAPLLGARAREVFQAHRPTVALFARVYLALLKTPGRDAARKAYLAALKQAPERMPEHYRSVVDKHQLTQRISGSSPSATEMTVGFWLRRMGDGTDELLASSLKQLIQDYDPPLYTELYGAPGSSAELATP